MHYRSEEYEDGGVELGVEKKGGCLLKEVRA
jgi:hypothetical protein